MRRSRRCTGHRYRGARRPGKLITETDPDCVRLERRNNIARQQNNNRVHVVCLLVFLFFFFNDRH